MASECSYDPLTWTVGLLEILLRANTEAWLERNSDVHGIRGCTIGGPAEILDGHSHRHLMLPRDRDLIPNEVTEFCDSQTHAQLHAWLLQHRETLGQGHTPSGTAQPV
jgi:hypothetical protein